MTASGATNVDRPGVNADQQGVTIARKGRFRKAFKLVRLLANPRFRRAVVRTRVAAATEHREVAFGGPFATVVDVGAHHGQFALIARDLFPAAKIVCVEPLPDAVERLRSVIGDDPRISVAATAVAASAGQRDMHVSQKTDSSSLLPIMQPYVDAFPGTEEARTVSIDVTTLDALFADAPERPCLLKIDAQGGELEVLRGATRLLGDIDAAYIECSFVEFYAGQALADEVIAELLRHGLRLDGAYSVVRDANGRCLQADLLFRRRASAAKG
jgi:FkbM family methyltransferase